MRNQTLHLMNVERAQALAQHHATLQHADLVLQHSELVLHHSDRVMQMRRRNGSNGNMSGNMSGTMTPVGLIQIPDTWSVDPAGEGGEGQPGDALRWASGGGVARRTREDDAFLTRR